MPGQTAVSGTPHNTKGDLFRSFDVEDFAVPHFKDEEWRYTPLRKLRGLHDGSFAPIVEQEIAVTLPNVDREAGASGHLQEKLPGVTVRTLDPQDPLLRRTGGAVDRIGAQVWSSLPSAQYLGVAANTQVIDTITIDVTGRGEGVTSCGATVVEVEAGAEATVVMRYRGSGTHADNIEILVGDAARLNLIVDIDWNPDAVHVLGAQAVLGRDATLRASVAEFGGDVVRVFPRVAFTAPGGDAELTGVYFADAGQYFENRLLVDHSVPHCRSNVLYKGALQGEKGSRDTESHTAWVGDIIIRAGAEGTDTYETNRNLVLSEGARADAVPNLEIETGQIKAGHAATVGRFEDDHLFYLQARGIPEKEARRLIVHGFFSEAINFIPEPAVRESLEARIAGELDNVNLTQDVSLPDSASSSSATAVNPLN